MFELYADKVKLAVRRWEPVTSGSVEVYRVRFQFSEDWDGLEKTAVFKGGGETVSVLLDDSCQCSVPWEVLAVGGGYLSAGVRGTGADGTVVLPTVWASLGFIQEGAGAVGEAQPPAPDIWEQKLSAKQAKLTGGTGQVVGFDGGGHETAVTLEGGDNVTIAQDGERIIISAAGGGGLSLQAISITTPPGKTVYQAGESFDPTGMVVTAGYGGGITRAVTGFAVSPAGSLPAGTDKVTVTYAEGGRTAAAEQAVTVVRRALPVPVQAQALTYTGSAQSPVWTGCNPSAMTVGGNASGTDAGSYEAVFTLVDPVNTEWVGGSTADQTVVWTIGKAARGLTVDKPALSLTAEEPAGTITAVWSGGGALSAVSGDPDVAAASVEGGTVTVTGLSSGSTTVTLRVAEGDNYLPAEAETVVTTDFPHIYGVSWDGTADTRWTRTDAAADFVDPVPYAAGAAAYGSPFDDIQPWAGMQIVERAGGTMVSIPKFWYKLTQSGGGLEIRISAAPEEGFHVSPAHMDRGDGRGERDTVYVGRYFCGSSYKSATGQTPKNNTSTASFRAKLQALSETTWPCDFPMWFTIWLLYLVEFADWNSQAAIGFGCGDDGGARTMGYTDSMPYHTGTVQASRAECGFGTQYRHIEGLWDNLTLEPDGIYINQDGANLILNPENYGGKTGGVMIFPTVGSEEHKFPSAFSVTESPFPLFYASANDDGSAESYSCDWWYFTGDTKNNLRFGGYYSPKDRFGLFHVSFGTVLANAASRPQELPNAEEA